MKKLWFKRKYYGYGWRPSTWEGWTVIALFVFAMLLLSFHYADELNQGLVWNYIIRVALLIIILVFISAYKGEKPKWQWGKPNEK